MSRRALTVPLRRAAGQVLVLLALTLAWASCHGGPCIDLTPDGSGCKGVGPGVGPTPGNPNPGNYTCGSNAGPYPNTYVCNLPSYLGTQAVPGEPFDCGLSNQCFDLDEARAAAAKAANTAINIQCVLLHTGPSNPTADALLPSPFTSSDCVIPGNDNGMCAMRSQMCVTTHDGNAYASAPATQVCCPGLTCAGVTSTADTGKCCTGLAGACNRPEECCLPFMDTTSNVLLCGNSVSNADVKTCCLAEDSKCDPNNDQCCLGGTFKGHCLDTNYVDTRFTLKGGGRGGPRCTCVPMGGECDDDIDCCDEGFACMQGHCLTQCLPIQAACDPLHDLCCTGLICAQGALAQPECCKDRGVRCDPTKSECCRGSCSSTSNTCVCKGQGATCNPSLNECCVGLECDGPVDPQQGMVTCVPAM